MVSLGTLREFVLVKDAPVVLGQVQRKPGEPNQLISKEGIERRLTHSPGKTIS